ncbi:MAG: hypothetical protein ACXVCP_01325 [Bdellovibrio sp.]
MKTKLKRALPLSVLALSFCWSSYVGGLKFVLLSEPITIKAQKNSPPYIAFEELLEFDRTNTEFTQFEKAKFQELAVNKNTPPLFAKKIELPEMTFTKNIERVYASEPVEGSDNDNSWMEQLPRTQAMRLQEAQRRSEVLSEDWTVPTWSAVAKETLVKSGALALDSSSTKTNIYVAGVNSAGQVKTRVPGLRLPAYNAETDKNEYEKDNVDTTVAASKNAGSESELSFLGNSDAGTSSYVIVGPLEITGGLAITNDHHIEIRRSEEGVLKELGKVDLKKGQYNISVENTTGAVLARLIDKQGKILGEGSIRLSHIVAGTEKSVQGPKIRIAPRPDFAGVITSAYNSRPVETAPHQTVVTFVKGASEAEVKKDGMAGMDNVTKGSSTVMRAAAPKHLQTTSIVISGQEFKTQLFPISMINALEDIVGQQRAITYQSDSTIIWGKVTLDGKALSGIDVIVESDATLQPVYFNQLMLPDPNLKATSENGLYAFVNVSPGFHSLLATRAESILGYQNVVVEKGSVALGNIEASMKTEAVPVRVYDAFTGNSEGGLLTMQSLQDDVEAPSGVATVSLPQISRLGMLRIRPHSQNYASAQYLYNDTDSFVHVPLIQLAWLSSIKNYLRLDDQPSVGTVIGFVPDEDFEVYLAGYDKFDQRSIVYFDVQGRILQNRKGMAGGGFILYNVPEDIHEVVVLGSRTQKIYSRVLPVDPDSISVLNFRE